MLISDIYEKFSITPMLQVHQKRAAAVGMYIADHWNDQINKETIIQALLLHDMGNIIKFDLENKPQLLGAELPRVDFWKKKQQEFIQTYGTDEHTATLEIAKSLGVSEDILYLLEHMGSGNLSKTVELDNWELKIVSYADLRAGPFGILSVNKRFDDLIARYKGRNHPIANIERTERNRLYCLDVEKQIQKHTTILLEDITEDVVAPLIEELSTYRI